MRNDGGGSFDAVDQALNWVLDNHVTFNITVVSISLGDESNLTDDAPFDESSTRRLVGQLRELNIPVVVAAGNDYFQFKKQGMSFPTILRETVSVGAVYRGDHIRKPGHFTRAVFCWISVVRLSMIALSSAGDRPPRWFPRVRDGAWDLT